MPQGHQRAACELLSHSACGYYLILASKTGKVRLDKEHIRQEERPDSKYLISTSDHTLAPEDVALRYKQLAEPSSTGRSRGNRTIATRLEEVLFVAWPAGRRTMHGLPERR